MRYAVAVKQVPDTMEMSVDENGSLVRAGVPSILNPYDEYALTRMLETRSEDDEVIVFTMGPPQAGDALVKCLELGADEAYLITDRAFAGADVWATARALTAFILKFVPDADLYVFGRQAIDGDTGQVPYEVAAQLGALGAGAAVRTARDHPAGMMRSCPLTRHYRTRCLAQGTTEPAKGAHNGSVA